MNNLLLRQIKRRFGSLENIPNEIKDFIQDINITYKNFEDDEQLLQNSIEISSGELRDALIKQKYNAEKQNETIVKIKEAIIELNPTIQNVENGLISSDSTYLFNSLIRLIEERKQMEIALQNTMIRNKALLDANPDIMFVLDKSCIFKDFHTNNNEILYVQPSHFVGFKVSKVLPEHIALMIQEKVNSVICSKHAEYLTYQMEIQGSVKFFEARFVLHGIDEVLVIVSDITQRKTIENALNESEEKYRNIIENIQDVFYQTDIAGKIIEISPSIKYFSKLNRDELIGSNVIDLYFNPDDRILMLNSIREKGELSDYEVLLKSRLGNKKYVSVNARLIFDENGNPHHIDGALRDITERKQAEELLNQTRQNYESFFNTIDDFLFVLDEQGNFIHTNNTVTERLGFSNQELLGKSVLMLHPLEYRNEAGRIVDEVLNGITAFCPVPLITKTGILIPVETRVKRGIWDNKSVIFGVTKDISRIKLSEEKFSKLFHINPSACGLNDLDTGKYLEVNEAFYALFGFNKNEVIGKTAVELDILTEETKVSVLQNADSFGNVKNKEVDLKTKNGNIIHAFLSSENFYVQEKRYRFTVVHNITELKEIETSLKESEATLEEAQVIAKMGSWEYDAETQKNIWSKSCFDIFGVNPTDIDPTFEYFRSRIHSEDKYLIDKGLSEIMKCKKAIKIEMRIIFDDGSIKWLQNNIVPYFNGDKLLKLKGANIDITELKLAEEALRNSEEKYRSLIQNSSEPIFSFNPDGTYKFVNEAFAKVFGLQPKDLVGKTPHFLFSKEEAEYRLNMVRHVIETGQKNEIEVKVKGQSNKEQYYLTILDPIKNDKNEVVFITCFSKDITERKLAELEVKRKNEELLKVITEKDKFFSIIAHDLRSPFNAFLGLTQIMAEDLTNLSMNELQNIANSMNNSAINLFRLLENLLQWSRMQQGLITYNPEMIELSKLVDESIEMILEIINKKNILLTIDIPSNLKLNADSNMLQTVIRNLVSNAVKFTTRGGKINISAKFLSSDTVEVAINDTGIGMNKEFLENIFRLDTDTNRKGTEGEPSTGLGLLLCKEFVEKNGGKIWAESEEGKGSCFRFTLPFSKIIVH